ncbi:RHOMBOID-like protein 3 [Amaranthus tricolor]|uniref:RHOMBOID-like protein 3 n=1 Tax=Amaranthus tricolor TaxID=29722 RepID=UPI0025836332|nr:RHOMBOID-like protein 3 [Amaranthus tricolor]
MENQEDNMERRTMQNNNGVTRSLSHVWDDLDYEWKSWLIPIFMGINVLIFLVMMFINNCPSHNNITINGRSCVWSFLGRFSFHPLHYNPLLGPGPHTLMKMGAITWSAVVQHHQGWRLFISIWLHTGLIHLLINMLSLFFVGTHLEQKFGFLKIGTIYLLAGIGGNMTSCLFYPKHICVGPTSALLGLIGSMFADLVTNLTIYNNKVLAGLTILLMFVINLVITVVPHPHNAGPIGGFIIGILLGFILLPRPVVGWHHLYDHSTNSKFKPHQYVFGITSLVILVIGFILGLIMLFRT